MGEGADDDGRREPSAQGRDKLRDLGQPGLDHARLVPRVAPRQPGHGHADDARVVGVEVLERLLDVLEPLLGPGHQRAHEGDLGGAQQLDGPYRRPRPPVSHHGTAGRFVRRDQRHVRVDRLEVGEPRHNLWGQQRAVGRDVDHALRLALPDELEEREKLRVDQRLEEPLGLAEEPLAIVKIALPCDGLVDAHESRLPLKQALRVAVLVAEAAVAVAGRGERAQVLLQ